MKNINVIRGFETCSGCGETNTEFIEIKETHLLQDLSTRVTDCGITFLNRLSTKLGLKLVVGKEEVRTIICQSCVSKSFRSFKKDY